MGAFDKPRPIGWDPDGWGQVGENPPRGTPVRSLLTRSLISHALKPFKSPRSFSLGPFETAAIEHESAFSAHS